MAAHNCQGSVSIVRCRDNEDADRKVEELLHHITMADGYNAPQPKHREIWMVGFQLKEMVCDELSWFECFKPERIVRRVRSAEELYTNITACNFPVSLGHFFGQLSVSDSSYVSLYRMLEAEDYEDLMAYLLREHPEATDVTKEDYVLNMFVEREKKRSNNGNCAQLSGR